MGDKSSAVLFILIFLAFAAVSAFLVVFFIKTNMPKNTNIVKNDNEVILTTKNTTIDINKNTTTISNLDDSSKTNYNNLLKNYIKPLLATLVVDKEEPNLLTNVNYNMNMLKEPNFKYSFALYTIYYDNIPRDETKVEGDDLVKYSLNDFNNYYNNLYGESFDINSLKEFNDGDYPTKMPSILDNTLYTTIFDRYADEHYMDIKAVSYDNNTIYCDIIVYKTIEEYNQYSDPSINKYPSELIYTRVEFTYDNNKLNKIVFRNI